MPRENLRNLFAANKAYVVATNGKMPVLDGQNLTNIKPAAVRIPFWTANQNGILAWAADGKSLTCTHDLNCVPLVQVHTNAGMLVYPEVTVLSGTQFVLDFGTAPAISENAPWTITIVHGGEYGASATLASSLGTLVDLLGSYLEQATALHDEIHQTPLDPTHQITTLSGASATIVPGEVYELAMAADFTLSASTETGYGESVLFVTPGAYTFAVADGIALSADMSSGNRYRLLASWTPYGVKVEQTAEWEA